MEKIEHTTVLTNGINMHVASIGSGPPILFLHGFPELWYSWRHQILTLSSLGYRAIAPDLRGYGGSDAPLDVEAYTGLHVVGDLIGLLDALGVDQVFLVGHDWGAIIAWYLCLLRPDRVKALVNTSVAFMPRNPKVKTIAGFRDVYGDDFYMCRFQEPGVVEEELSRIGSAKVMAGFLSSRDPRPIVIPKEDGLDRLLNKPISLPSWVTEEDINHYASVFDKTGYTGGLNYYRAMDLTWELMAPWTGARVKVPVKFILGDLDITYNFPGVKNYLHGGGFKRDVPLLQEVVVMEGVGHFLNQEKAEEVSAHIYDFIKNF